MELAHQCSGCKKIIKVYYIKSADGQLGSSLLSNGLNISGQNEEKAICSQYNNLFVEHVQKGFHLSTKGPLPGTIQFQQTRSEHLKGSFKRSHQVLCGHTSELLTNLNETNATQI